MGASPLPQFAEDCECLHSIRMCQTLISDWPTLCICTTFSRPQRSVPNISTTAGENESHYNLKMQHTFACTLMHVEFNICEFRFCTQGRGNLTGRLLKLCMPPGGEGTNRFLGSPLVPLFSIAFFFCMEVQPQCTNFQRMK